MVGPDIPALHVRPVFTPAQDKDRLASGILPGLDVDLGIPHKIRVARVRVTPPDGGKRLEDIADARLAAIAPVRRLAGAVMDPGDTRSGPGRAIVQALRDAPELVVGEYPFADTRLVRYHENMVPGVGQQFQRFHGTRDEMKILDVGDIKAVAGKFIDHAISINKNNFHFFTGSLMPLMIS